MSNKLCKCNHFNYSSNVNRQISYLIEIAELILQNFSKEYSLVDFNQCYSQKIEHLTNLLEFNLLGILLSFKQLILIEDFFSLEHFVPNAIRRKIISLSQCKLRSDSTFAERLKLMRIAVSIGKRVAFEILVKHSDSHKILYD